MSKRIINRKAIIIPGSQKSGTTTLFNILTRHPLVDKPKKKEVQFFSLDEKTIKKNLNWYENRFSKGNEYIIDASTFYFQSKRAPKYIKRYIEKPKIIIILRDPAKRAYSGYLHMHKKIICADKRNFHNIVSRVKGPEIEDVITTENLSIKESIKNDRILEDYIDEDYLESFGVDFDSYFEDNLWPYRHFQNSLYSYHLKNYKRRFKDIKIIFMEELINEPEYTLKDVLYFLKLDADNISFKIPHKNVTKVPQNDIVRYLLRIYDNAHNIMGAKSIVDKMVLPYLGKKLYKNPKISKNTYLKCKDILMDEYKYWYTKYDKLEKYWSY